MKDNNIIESICVTKQELFNSMVSLVLGSFLSGVLTTVGAMIIFG